MSVLAAASQNNKLVIANYGIISCERAYILLEESVYEVINNLNLININAFIVNLEHITWEILFRELVADACEIQQSSFSMIPFNDK